MESNTLKKIIPIEQLWINLDNFENRLYEISSSKDSYLNDISQVEIVKGPSSLLYAIIFNSFAFL